MPNFISEDHIEKAIIGIFKNNLGYRHANCMDNDTTGRLEENEVAIRPPLKQQLLKLNPALPLSAIEEAFEQLCQTRLDKSDLVANKEIYGLLKNGVQVIVNNQANRKEPVTVRVIDYENETNNDWLVVSQLWVKGPVIRRRPDLVVFVNGLPLIFIELKNSNIALRNAYDDNLTNYKKDIPLLFHYNAICILSNGLETKVGGFNAGYAHFFSWLRAENEKQVTDKERIRQEGISLQYAVLGLCKKRRLLDYLELQGLDIKKHRKRILAVDENGFDLEHKFKDPGDSLQLVFVCSMWLTGFDAPTVSTLYLDKPMKDHTLMQTIARANRVTDYLIYNKPKRNGLIVDYYNVFKNLKKAFASYGGGFGAGNEKEEDAPVQEKDQLYVLLQDAINECDSYCRNIEVNLTNIVHSGEVFSKLGLFDEYADRILANDDRKNQFIVFDNTIDALYEACKPEILGRRKDFPLAAIIYYLREVIDGKADRGNLDSAKRRISQLLDESIIADPAFTESETATAESPAHNYAIKSGKESDLSKLDIQKLKEEYKQAPYKNIEIADLRAFISDKLQAMMDRNVSRSSFAQKLQEIIDRYNAGNSDNEKYMDDLMDFVQKMKDEDLRAAREGMTEAELELFDLLKKENLTKAEEQKVKLAAKNLLHRLREERPTILINDWHKDNQTRMQVQTAIKKVLDEALPESYDKAIYSSKCEVVFDHFILQAQKDDRKAYA